MPNRFKKKVNRLLDMPSEIILNTPKITLDSNEEIWIENYKGIIEYCDELIRINTLDFTVVIEGKSLVINYMTKEEISISGNIVSVVYD